MPEGDRAVSDLGVGVLPADTVGAAPIPLPLGAIGPTAPHDPAAGGPAAADARRRSFAVLVGSRTAAQAFDQAVDLGAAIILATRTSSALAVVFALSAHKYLTVVAAPAVGRLSDRTQSPLGRRVPHMAMGLAVAAVATWWITVAPGYWGLLACLVVARLGLMVFRVARFAATPDIFGRSRWARGMLAFAVLGAAPQLGILVLVRQTWDRNEPSTWDLPFQVAAVGMAVAAIAVVTLVREAPGARVAAAEAARVSWREVLAETLAAPQARVLLASGGLLAATGAAVGRLLPIWADDRLGLGPDGLIDVGLAVAASAAVAAPLGWMLVDRAHPRTLAVAASLVGAAGLGAVTTVSTPAAFVALLAATIPLTVAAVAALAPAIAGLVPTATGVGGVYGSVLGPLALVTTLGGFVAALAVDVTSEPAAIWAVASALLLANAIVLGRLRLPAGARTSRLELRAMAGRAGRQVGIVVEHGSEPVGEDADGPEGPAPRSRRWRLDLNPRRHLAGLFEGAVHDDDVAGRVAAPHADQRPADGS